MKIKNKIQAALAAAFSCFTLLATTISASAWDGRSGSGTSPGSWSSYDTPYGILKGSNLAWRVDLYISKNADGKINKSSDVIGNQLALTGSVFCTSSDYMYWNGHNYPTYLQVNFTNNCRNSFDNKGFSTDTDSEGNFGVTQYTLPTLVEFDKDAPFYHDASSHPVAIADSGKITLFDGAWKVSDDLSFIQTRVVNDFDSDYVETKKIIEQLTEKNKGEFLDNTIGGLNAELRESIKSKNGGSLDVDAANKYILPTSPDCMVEWAMVITPIYRFESQVPFYYYLPNSTKLQETEAYIGGEIPCVALDAYWFAQYDVATNRIASDGGFNFSKNGHAIYTDPYGNRVKLLSHWLSSNAGAPAGAIYCTEQNDKNCYLGVNTSPSGTTQQQWYNLLLNNPKEYAARGGIAVFTTKIEDSPAKVYYHTYTYRIDENDADSLPTGYTKGKTTDDPYLLKFLDELDTPTVSVTEGTLPEGNTFSPKKAFENDKKNLGLNGLAVAAMSPQPSIKQPGAQEEYPLPTSTDYYLERVPDIIDAHIKPTNPLADTATLQTGKATPGNTADDPKEYHVMLIHVDIKPKIAEDT